ncbi:MAG: formylglycine-generating enzyme family protein, partial [Okeania sp. SIO2D1]|nr:formylglycine-generating enzyme family protein [Okeania sp. SIO2D1]
KGASRPVERVSWKDATAFCQKLLEITGKKYSLPSESQWEYACRAGTTTPFYFGETMRSDLVNYYDNLAWETTDVGIFPPNSFGLYDMHGNVWEWCQDIWHGDYIGAPIDGSAWETGSDSEKRMIRGGSWDVNSRNCRSARRFYEFPIFSSYNKGFRVVLSVSAS